MTTSGRQEFCWYRHHLDVFLGIQQFAEECRVWRCRIDPYAEATLQDAHPEIPYDGVVGRVTPERMEAAAMAGIPVVNVWQSSPVRCPGVFSDGIASGIMVADHLPARGFRRFGFLGRHRYAHSKNIGRSFVAAVNEAGFPCSPCSVSVNYSSTVDSVATIRIPPSPETHANTAAMR